jgi:ubiquinone/menaquinone biosynthesis C-methylase UbiE
MAVLPVNVELIETDVQDLPFDDDIFDTAVGTCCSARLQIRCRA